MKIFNFIYWKAKKYWLDRERESHLSEDAPAALPKLMFVMVDFLEIFQKFNKNNFQYKKHYWGIVSQTRYARRRCIGGGVWFFLTIAIQVHRLSAVG